jgi:hypothetical protein
MRRAQTEFLGYPHSTGPPIVMFSFSESFGISFHQKEAFFGPSENLSSL